MAPFEMSSSFAKSCALSLLCGTKATLTYDTTEWQKRQKWTPRRDARSLYAIASPAAELGKYTFSCAGQCGSSLEALPAKTYVRA
eukprot:scaffold2381_cov31-Attheya_sp.AAC.1